MRNFIRQESDSEVNRQQTLCFYDDNATLERFKRFKEDSGLRLNEDDSSSSLSESSYDEEALEKFIDISKHLMCESDSGDSEIGVSVLDEPVLTVKVKKEQEEGSQKEMFKSAVVIKTESVISSKRRKVACVVCSKEITASNMRRHMKTLHGIMPKVEGVQQLIGKSKNPRFCDYPGCGMQYFSSSGLSKHRKRKHGKAQSKR